MISNITEIFCDGGLIGRNPSPVGGTWAWCHVDAYGNRVNTGKGVLPAGLEGLQYVTNNNSELWALIQAIAALPPGWSGKVYSDSQVALGWAFWGFRTDEVPPAIRLAIKIQIERIDRNNCQPILLDGHPSRAHLAAGLGKRGNPVSVHNVWADLQCQELAAQFRIQRAINTGEAHAL